MDQHEKDWLDLGRQLKDYQPTGQPGKDFLDFQKLQRKEEPRSLNRRIVWWFLPAFLLVLSVTLYWQVTLPNVTRAEAPVTVRVAPDLRTENPAVVTANANPDVANGSLENRGVITANTNPKPGSAARKVETGSENPAQSFPTLALPQNHDGGKMNVSPVGGATKSNNSVPSLLSDQSGPGKVPPIFTPEPKAEAVELADALLSEPPVITKTLSAGPIDQLPVEVKLPGVEVRRDGDKKQPRLTLGAGLSNHWRGENFLQDVDRGLYVNLGLYQPLGRRISLEGQVGYRAHDLNVPVLNNTKKPWSYHKDEIHNTGQMGETRVYIYEGIVESYRAVEFSLLVHYQLQPKIGLHAGARYALPSIQFRRLVHGPDDENPFRDFIEQQEIVKTRDFGGILGLNYRLTTHLSLQGEVHLGLVDLIENAAQEGERFNRSNSLSVGVRYLFD